MSHLPFVVKGIVIHGDKVGRTIGFPTANLDIQIDETQLELGVYFAECFFESELTKKYWCLPYFGPRFIFGEVKNSFEVYIYDFNKDVYGQMLQAKILKKLREPIKFTTLDALKEQLEKDTLAGQKLFPK